MKKILSIIFACSFFVYSGISYASPVSNGVDTKQLQEKVKLEQSIMSESKIPLQKVTIDPNNSAEVELTINDYDVLPETANDIREFAGKVQNGELASGEISLFVPAVSLSAVGGSTTREYVGYKNKLYREEVVVYVSSSNPSEIGKTTKEKWADYVKKIITGTVNYYIDKALDSYTLDSWSMSKIFLTAIPTQVPATSDITHFAVFNQTVAKKNTYIQINDGIKNVWAFGYASESGSVYWQNYRLVQGYGLINDQDTPVVSKTLPNYNKGDEKAWQWYVQGGVTERFSNYKYGGVVFNAI
ncbi:hypothetical protein [Paenibacillus brevis]|uniref:Uncharacterized protein n=1 Tax=Paenibacillus brevis TaxID=2841508 RepID=A0ABS6FRN1_9BACL|nr:hypothetical protein [Paenibacillus brevis]MBU5671790.1 hypothetical protein [Paenibacillus brevis]